MARAAIEPGQSFTGLASSTARKPNSTPSNFRVWYWVYLGSGSAGVRDHSAVGPAIRFISADRILRPNRWRGFLHPEALRGRLCKNSTGCRLRRSPRDLRAESEQMVSVRINAWHAVHVISIIVSEGSNA